MRPGVAQLLATAAMAMIGAGPALAEPRAIGLRPGSGIVERSAGRSPRRDGARQAAAQAKRDRKDAKRARDAHRTKNGHECARWCAGRGGYGF